MSSWAGRHPRSFDLIVSGDTLNYFGDLDPVFTAAGTSLRPGGRFLFTLEHDQEPTLPRGFRIHPHGRYSHTESDVRQALAPAALELCWFRTCVLRKEVGRPVSGILVLARKIP